MYTKVVALFGLVAVAAAADLSVGREGGQLIFDKNVTASPAIWKQVQNLTVNATDDGLISRVVVIDNRPKKDGEAKVVDGGVGHNDVTIELKSPTVFRGFDFTVKVYASEGAAQFPQHPVPVGASKDGQTKVTPAVEDQQQANKEQHSQKVPIELPAQSSELPQNIQTTQSLEKNIKVKPLPHIL
ncbi:uncharacterized protein LOC118279245 [Spodoptera frugiperda]|uniref:Uncharacterized protein LOC118279245 n=1 Tax=Spodoptera frugiperda TaxID=7108 RepID=A0A9R0ERB8_SPOFR|nr:uncharacterized protein LOC118279245 [Spodoptera frugiperda]